VLSPGTVGGDAIREVGIAEHVHSGLRQWHGGMQIEQTMPMEELERERSVEEPGSRSIPDNAFLKEAARIAGRVG
jgi:hypothetical protein